MAAFIELEDWVTIEAVENAHRQAFKEMENPRSTFGEIGWRAAQARDPKLLKVLEIAAKPDHSTRRKSTKRRKANNHMVLPPKVQHGDSTLDSGLRDSGQGNSSGAIEVDLRGGSEVSRVPTVETASAVYQNLHLDTLQGELKSELQRLSGYTMKSARHRVKLIKSGELSSIQVAVASELAVSAGSYRLDLAENLLRRLEKITTLVARIEVEEKKDYEERFGKS